MKSAEQPRARERLERYVDGVLSGTILACNSIRLACERHRRDVENDLWYFDDDEADDVVEFAGMLRHWKGEWAGQPFFLEDWQVFVACSMLCWKITETGLRRFSEAYIEIPRKNGKTFLAAVIGLYLFVADGEPGAEIYTAATKKDQAKISHEDAKKIVAKSEHLRNRCLVHKDNIYDPLASSKYEPLGRDSLTADGLNPHGALIDEYHAHKTAELYDVIKSGMGARQQPLLFIITTAGFLLSGPCKQRSDFGIEVLKQTIEDDELFIFIAQPDEGDDWTDEITHRKVNPNYDISVKPRDMARACKRAQQYTSEQNNFLTKRLNMWVGQSERWIDLEDWKVCDQQTFDVESLKGRACFGGLDLSSTSDITACVWVFPDDEGEMYDVLARLWVPADNAIKRERKDRVPYRAWATDGWLTLTDGNVIDYEEVKAQIRRDSEDFRVVNLGFDPWASTQLSNDLTEEGVEMVQFRQGYASMSEPSKSFERLLKQGRLRLNGNPVLQWMASNVATETDPAGNIKPSKKKSGEKIDGIVALIMAIGRALDGDEGPSVYQDRGFMVL